MVSKHRSSMIQVVTGMSDRLVKPVLWPPVLKNYNYPYKISFASVKQDRLIRTYFTPIIVSSYYFISIEGIFMITYMLYASGISYTINQMYQKRSWNIFRCIQKNTLVIIKTYLMELDFYHSWPWIPTIIIICSADLTWYMKTREQMLRSRTP